jgi:hypothetical protein
MSRTQFSNAWDEGDRFWLYIVEHALNPTRARIYPIQNPAMKVDKFNFDQGWSQLADKEDKDTYYAGFFPGVKI